MLSEKPEIVSDCYLDQRHTIAARSICAVVPFSRLFLNRPQASPLFHDRKPWNTPHMAKTHYER